MSDIDLPPETGVRRRRSTGSWVMLAVLGAIVCVYLGLTVGGRYLGLSAERGRPGQHPAVGRTLADLQLDPLTGVTEPVTLADLRGQIVLLNFWGTWCGPCKIEFPHIATMAEKLKDEPNFRVLAVSCGPEADKRSEIEELRTRTQKFLQREHSRLPTYADPAAYTRRHVAMTLQDYNFAYPTTLMLDGEGVIRGVWLGYSDGYPEQMDQLVDELLHPAPK